MIRNRTRLGCSGADNFANCPYDVLHPNAAAIGTAIAQPMGQFIPASAAPTIQLPPPPIATQLTLSLPPSPGPVELPGGFVTSAASTPGLFSTPGTIIAAVPDGVLYGGALLLAFMFIGGKKR